MNSTLFAGTPGATPTDQIPYGGWQFMIVLPAKCLPSVWEEVEALKPRLPDHRKHPHWHGCQQQFGWVNDITYSYEGDCKSLLVHGVGCEKTWQEIDPEGRIS